MVNHDSDKSLKHIEHLFKINTGLVGDPNF